jgi:hypothetical protein
MSGTSGLCLPASRRRRRVFEDGIAAAFLDASEEDLEGDASEGHGLEEAHGAGDAGRGREACDLVKPLIFRRRDQNDCTTALVWGEQRWGEPLFAACVQKHF